jgi:hypothetical protein
MHSSAQQKPAPLPSPSTSDGRTAFLEAKA